MNYKKIITLVIAALGFTTACSKIVMEYGVPAASFELKGKVTDTLDNPIENIRVNIRTNDYPMKEIFTDMEGNYFFGVGDISFSDITVKVEDIDGEENGGEFATQTISFPIKSSDYVKEEERKDDNWYSGTARKEINFKLEKK